jgi:hypothetical protein
MVGHGVEHHHVAVDVAGLGERFLVRLPDAVDDRRLARIARRAVIEVAAEIDDAHGWFLPRRHLRGAVAGG